MFTNQYSIITLILLVILIIILKLILIYDNTNTNYNKPILIIVCFITTHIPLYVFHYTFI